MTERHERTAAGAIALVILALAAAAACGGGRATGAEDGWEAYWDTRISTIEELLDVTNRALEHADTLIAEHSETLRAMPGWRTTTGDAAVCGSIARVANGSARAEWELCRAAWLLLNGNLADQPDRWAKRLEDEHRQRALHAEERAAQPERFGPARLAVEEAEWTEWREERLAWFKADRIWGRYSNRHLRMRGSPVELPAEFMPAAPVD